MEVACEENLNYDYDIYTLNDEVEEMQDDYWEDCRRKMDALLK